MSKLWERLTDWEKSPVLQFMQSIGIPLFNDVYAYTIRQSSSENEDEVISNIVSLKHMGKRGVPILIDLLKCENQDWRTHALISKTLGEMEQIAFPYLIEALKHKDYGIRLGATKALSYIAAPASLPNLINALQCEEKYNVRHNIVRAVAEIAEKGIDVSDAFPALFEISKYDISNLWDFVPGALESIAKACDSIEKANKLEEKTEDSYKELLGKNMSLGQKTKIQVVVSNFMLDISGRKSELSKDGELLVGKSVKPPKGRRGRKYREIRRSRNG